MSIELTEQEYPWVVFALRESALREVQLAGKRYLQNYLCKSDHDSALKDAKELMKLADRIHKEFNKEQND